MACRPGGERITMIKCVVVGPQRKASDPHVLAPSKLDNRGLSCRSGSGGRG